MTFLRNQPYEDKDFPAFAAIKEQFGFLPNFFPAQTARPDFIDAEMAMTANTIVKDGALERRQKEYIFLVCSAANLSTYCVTAHCEIIRMLHLEGPEPEQIAIDYIHTDIPIADKALLNFCSKLNAESSKVGAGDIDTLRTYGFSEQQILEAVVLVGWAKFANVVAFGLGTVPDFHNRRILEELGKERAASRGMQVPISG
jgi:uncharacterized peroxidase-related enzyme